MNIKKQWVIQAKLKLGGESQIPHTDGPFKIERKQWLEAYSLGDHKQ